MNHGSHCKQHDHCEHCLHYCGTCDKPYCCKCGREWPAQAHNWFYTNPWWANYTIPCTTSGTYTWDGVTNIKLNAEAAEAGALYVACEDHSHKV